MLELQCLSKSWQPRQGQARALLQGINLRVQVGETVAILGPSGVGKSTLLKIVAGLEQPDSGRVLLDGTDITALPPERRGFALMFQDFALFPHLNVQDNVAFGLREKGLSKNLARAQACALLQDFGLRSLVTAKVWQLSGGEQQRVALARALITQPRVLLLDEPFSALDEANALRLRTEFRQRIASAGMAALLVTHDELEARAMASRGLRLAADGWAMAW